jgi:ketosteroid isomerase-like protein
MRKLAYLGAVMLVLLAITAGAFHLDAQAKSATDDKAAIQALYNRFNDAFNKRDVNGVMAVYGPDLFVFDVAPPREYASWDAYKKGWEICLRRFPVRSPTLFRS